MNFMKITSSFIGIFTFLFLSCGSSKNDVTVIETTVTRSSDLTRKVIDFTERKEKNEALTIRLDTTARFQTMDGFGAAITGSTCFNLLKMKSENRMKFLRETFSDQDGFGFSYIRISIGCSDFSLSEYTCWDDRKAGFSLTKEETDYVIPILKEILAINPNVKIIGSPWTCPRWMKVNNLIDMQPFESWTDGELNPAFYNDYGNYFIQWIQAFAAEGINIYAITPQNEPLNRGNSASLFMGWQQQRDFVNSSLAPKIKAAGLDVKVYLFDHNYNYDNIPAQNDYPLKIYESGIDDEIVVGAAYHNYGGSLSELADIHNKRPDKELIFSETSIGTWNNGRDLSTRLLEDMEEVALGTVNNWCKAVVVWNLMLDTERGPNRDGGCQTCYGAVDIDRSEYKTITRNSHYYIIAHLSSVVKPGAIRIGTNDIQDKNIVSSAFKNKDGSFALVLLNKSANSKDIEINDGTHSFYYTIPEKAVASFQW
ncbi:MAG: glycoside hydrolase family 30 beta sandwich domain-containing protein [Paludibacter sp.]|nr:glycoside hydrolase family 30 beta sandwich domain-containing protein [Paludibacter sp.]